MSQPKIRILAEPEFLAEHSDLDAGPYVFAYTITIGNEGDLALQLLERYWLITDGNGKSQEVQGSGVVGQQPLIKPGKSYSYSSSASFATPIGFMEGFYLMSDEQGNRYKVSIPAFRLAQPGQLH
jgi:ApaG protein